MAPRLGEKTRADLEIVRASLGLDEMIADFRDLRGLVGAVAFALAVVASPHALAWAAAAAGAI